MLSLCMGGAPHNVPFQRKENHSREPAVPQHEFRKKRACNMHVRNHMALTRRHTCTTLTLHVSNHVIAQVCVMPGLDELLRPIRIAVVRLSARIVRYTSIFTQWVSAYKCNTQFTTT